MDRIGKIDQPMSNVMFMYELQTLASLRRHIRDSVKSLESYLEELPYALHSFPNRIKSWIVIHS
jgi:hypothetical protein